MIDTSWAVRVVERLPEYSRGFAPRSQWGEGEWDDEPDLVEWRHAGLACLATRGSSGAWCGYVGVPGTHFYFGVHYDKVVEASSHQGLTFSDVCHGNICHVPRSGEPQHVWWLGFDCAHAFDLAPGLEVLRRSVRGPEPMPDMGFRDVYRTLGYVVAHVNALAEELALPSRIPSLLMDLVASAKVFLRKDLPDLWREIYLERDHWGRGPCEREQVQLSYGGDGDHWDRRSLSKVAAARRKDRVWNSKDDY
jgi:hypothetical protein